MKESKKIYRSSQLCQILKEIGFVYIEYTNYKEKNGGYSEGEPPLTIPNREVKPFSADGTAFRWESRSLPVFFYELIALSFLTGLFFCNYFQFNSFGEYILTRFRKLPK